jgi:hypothetical protein
MTRPEYEATTAMQEYRTAGESLNYWIRYMVAPQIDSNLPNAITH